jgi:Fe2+ or Zn2+ uptake regulation protein
MNATVTLNTLIQRHNTSVNRCAILQATLSKHFNCKHCGAINQVGVCEYCGSVYQKGK